MKEQLFKVSGNTRPKDLAGAIAKAFNSGHEIVELQMIGAAAVNQAVKATAIANRFGDNDGREITIVSEFINPVINGEEKTGLKMILRRGEKQPISA